MECTAIYLNIMDLSEGHILAENQLNSFSTRGKIACALPSLCWDFDWFGLVQVTTVAVTSCALSMLCPENTIS